MSVLMCVAYSSARTLYPGDREANYYCNSYAKVDSHFRPLLLPCHVIYVCLSQQLFVIITDEVDEQKYYIVLIYVSQPAEWLGGFWEVLFKPTHENVSI